MEVLTDLGVSNKNNNNYLKKLIYLDIITKERGAKYDSIISKCWKFIIKIPSI